ncbi:MAG: serine/threonine-protein kinase [Planctomycetes bacterium]|nr:serine/threonine-protein kinase [Planctomycetota bacterium]
MATPAHERLEELYQTALEQDSEAEREAFLDEACGGDSELRSHVEGLLRVREQVGSFLDAPPVDPQATLESQPSSEIAGTLVGRYKILQEIGEGGFGKVYMAEQEQPVRRKVALKIIKPGMDTKQVIARFEAERQALALMDHPNIARVLDAGATEMGRPYFVMELVKGIAITEYCDKHKLSTQQRLELFIPVCHAVQHAHQKGIIHRDLKPNNVLVTLHDTRPMPKVIDFGIAKATGQRLTEKTLFTEFCQFIGTPEYMSPDQAEISGLDVDTRTDVYSLGVLLYELLTGTTPFDAITLRRAAFDEIKRIIREDEPPKPSARLHTLSTTQEALSVAHVRQTEPALLPRLIRGDLDWIVMKALEKDRTRRYQTASDLAADVERHLSHEPVVAGPPSAIYKFRKFVRRHRLGVLAGSIVATALVVGFSLATVGLVHANRSRAALVVQRDAAEQARANAQRQRARAVASADEARKQAARSLTVNHFLQEMLRSVDPGQALGREVTVRYVLDEAARKIDEGALVEQPEVEAAVRQTLGETYATLGLYDAAEVHLRTARTMRHEQLGDEHPDTLCSNRALARLLRVKGGFAEAEALLRHTVEIQRRVLGDEHRDTLSTRNELALALWGPGRFAEAEAIHRQTLAIQRRVLGEEHVDTLESLGHLGAVCRALGRHAEAEPLLRRALELSQRVLGEWHPRTAVAMNNLGELREDRGDYEQAERLYRQTYEVDRHVLGADHPQTQIPVNNLLRVLQVQGKTAEIRPLVVERLARMRRAAEHPGADALTLHAYAWELLNCEPVDLRDAAAALPIARRASELDGGRDAAILDTLATAQHMVGNLEQAIATQRQAIARVRAGGPYDRSELEAKLVNYLLQRGDLVKAAGVSWEGLAARLGESLLPDTAPGASLIHQSKSLSAAGRFDEAADLLRVCLAMRQKTLPEGHWLIADTISQLGGVIAEQGAFEEAEPLLLDACARLEENRRAPLEERRAAIQRIVRLYRSWSQPDRAEEWQQRLPETADASE